ncbi:MAG TPA: hypothetical protein VKR54_04240 [Candidatus Babeliales bacterium]|jgi:hypothetical protein|nr:hypothetical protein [Candidatus Babeliales bacterium]
MVRPDFAEASTGRRAFTPELAEGQDERGENFHLVRPDALINSVVLKEKCSYGSTGSPRTGQEFFSPFVLM